MTMDAGERAVPINIGFRERSGICVFIAVRPHIEQEIVLPLREPTSAARPATFAVFCRLLYPTGDYIYSYSCSLLIALFTFSVGDAPDEAGFDMTPVRWACSFGVL